MCSSETDTHTQRRIQSNPLEFEASWCRKTTSETTQTSAASALILTGTAAITTIKADQHTRTHAHRETDTKRADSVFVCGPHNPVNIVALGQHTHIVASKVFFNTGEVELYKYTATTAHISRSSSTLAVLCADRTYDLNITLNGWFWWWGMCKQ